MTKLLIGVVAALLLMGGAVAAQDAAPKEG